MLLWILTEIESTQTEILGLYATSKSSLVSVFRVCLQHLQLAYLAVETEQ